mmetsp:Transcript_27898/g.76721  ORF Transcript_27898/g.76721 Transcript_27898/m.76721 type:complete len:193 (-) Transcript_27898:245-823(-)|eukprot:CAMPEP_0179106406 /NCGR_PEP_ID=MMETSP0796-20121207/49474_1 /TAXON_ID=73915 /ORGANISM="Pyrodinium bahamense, Strain pbaha01" /LENGTH=192 /DNA_ID=CAMNT_0020804437 /DNA_START=56 /DNA_END=634 /DNA_ORIENTATION=+
MHRRMATLSGHCLAADSGAVVHIRSGLSQLQLRRDSKADDKQCCLVPLSTIAMTKEFVVQELHLEVEDVLHRLGTKLTVIKRSGKVHAYCFHDDPPGSLNLLLFVCDDPREVQLRAVWGMQGMPSAVRASLHERASKWNRDDRQTKAFIDMDGDLWLKMNVSQQEIQSLKDVLPELIKAFQASAIAVSIGLF